MTQPAQLTIYEQLKKQRGEILDIQRVLNARIDDIGRRINNLEAQIHLLQLSIETSSRYITNIDKLYAKMAGAPSILDNTNIEEVEIEEEKKDERTYTRHQIHTRLKEIFGKRLLEEDFLNYFVEEGYTRCKYNKTTHTTTYCPLKKGVAEGICAKPPISQKSGKSDWSMACKYTEKAVDCVVLYLKSNGWKEVEE